ncbi:hypothetical protein ACTHO0_22065 [Cytobacillus praedii]
MGVTVTAIFSFTVSFIALYAMKKVMNGIRVTKEEELMGFRFK